MEAYTCPSLGLVQCVQDDGLGLLLHARCRRESVRLMEAGFTFLTLCGFAAVRWADGLVLSPSYSACAVFVVAVGRLVSQWSVRKIELVLESDR